MNKFWQAAMLLKQNNPKVVKGILFTGLLTLLASCGNSSAIENLVKADPKLIADEVNESSITSSESSQETVSNTPVLDSSTEESAATQNERNTVKRSPDSVTQKTVEPESFQPQPKSAATKNLPNSFPPSFPLYPQAELLEIQTGADASSGTISWSSSDNRKAIADYYQAELTTNDWKIIKPFNLKPEQKWARAIAIKDEQRVALTLQPLPDNQAKNEGTKLSVVYQPLSAEIANSGISEAIDNDIETTQTDVEPKIAQQLTLDEQESLNKTNSAPALNTKEDVNLSQNNNERLISTANFTDLDNAPEQLNQTIATVASLGILTPYTGQGNTEVRKFAPNAVITKGEYARWLIAANNRYYQDNPGKKIYIPNDAEQSAFQDVKQAHPDFGAIQGLAEAGLIPSRLTEDSTNLLFKPDAPLTREDLVTWKVPLDMRQALPKASIEAIEESWGFQDATDIDSSAVRALYADFQNGDRSNIRRVFGFTTLFQPKKPVTRAEAAASLWYFGFQGDGVTAKEVWDLESQTEG